jgi:hypothetical protein
LGGLDEQSQQSVKERFQHKFEELHSTYQAKRNQEIKLYEQKKIQIAKADAMEILAIENQQQINSPQVAQLLSQALRFAEKRRQVQKDIDEAVEEVLENVRGKELLERFRKDSEELQKQMLEKD